MNAKWLLSCLFVAALSSAATWFLTKHWPAKPGAGAAAGNPRKVLFYQSAMHPWIKSDQPGHCTICGMALVPVYEGEKGFDTEAGLVSLSASTVNVLHVQTDPVRRQPLRRTLRVAGTIEDDDTRHRVLSAYVDGRIEKLFVNYVGAEVVAGERLATLYSPPLLTAEREYVALARQASLAGAAGLAPEQQRLIDAAAQRLLRLGLTRRQIEELPQKPEGARWSDLVAPMTGTVVAREVYEGQYVKEGDKLFELADFSTMWFLFNAYEQDLGWIRVGQQVAVTTPAVPGKVFEAPITFIDPTLDEATRSAKARVELPNPLIEEGGVRRRKLLHKLYAEGLVQIEVPEVLAVPRSAVLSPGAQTVVYVDLGGGTYQQRQVKIGRRGDTLWEVLDGLREGERVVTMGNLLIDAQAQLHQAVSGGTPAGGREHPVVPTEVRPDVEAKAVGLAEHLAPAQRQTAEEFLAVVDGLAAALAQDRVADYNKELARLHPALGALARAVGETKGWTELVKKLDAVGHLGVAADLTTARQAFFPLSLAVVELARRLRDAHPEFATLKIYQCPMADRAFPGAPKNGYWIQLQPPLRNPFFGAEMLDCGREVK